MELQLDKYTLPANVQAARPTEGGLFLSGPRVTLNLPAAPVRYLYSGWQSWSLTAWVEMNRLVRPMRPSILHPGQADPVYVHEARPNGSWYGAVELLDGQIIFLGALGLESHVRLDGQTLTGWYESPVGRIDNPSYEWFLAAGDETEIFSRYAELLGERFGKGRVQHPPRVWCSWYSLYTDIYENQLLKILSDLGPFDDVQGLPFDVFQIDDGWQIGIGNWEANTKFPSGMDGLAARIKAAGRTAGLWLAPLLVVPSSSLYREHLDWLLRDQNGKLVSSGFNWGEPLYALDTTHPAALDWLAALMKKVRGWGYDYAKLDFLYAGALPGKHHVDMPREAAYRNGLKVIREALGEAYFLTCGAPILPSLGLCDGMRVGPDVAGDWAFHRDDDLLMNFGSPGVRNALRTVSHRLWLQPLVHTDPDVVYFRTHQNNLTLEQKSLLQDMAAIAGFKATSDIPSWLTNKERAALREYLETGPKIERTGRTSFRIGKRAVDFAPFIQMPQLPGFATNLLGSVVGGLANIPLVMRIFDKLSRKSLTKTIEANPV